MPRHGLSDQQSAALDVLERVDGRSWSAQEVADEIGTVRHGAARTLVSLVEHRLARRRDPSTADRRRDREHEGVPGVATPGEPRSTGAGVAPIVNVRSPR